MAPTRRQLPQTQIRGLPHTTAYYYSQVLHLDDAIAGLELAEQLNLVPVALHSGLVSAVQVDTLDGPEPRVLT